MRCRGAVLGGGVVLTGSSLVDRLTAGTFDEIEHSLRSGPASVHLMESKSEDASELRAVIDELLSLHRALVGVRAPRQP